MTNRVEPITTKITRSKKWQETGTIQIPLIHHQLRSSKTEVLTKAAQTASSIAKLKTIIGETITYSQIHGKSHAYNALVDISVSMRILDIHLGTRCRPYKTFTSRSCTDHITSNITEHSSYYEVLLIIVKKRTLWWYGYIIRSSEISKISCREQRGGKRRKGKQCQCSAPTQ